MNSAAAKIATPDGRSLTSVAFDLLRNDVIRGLLRPGERLRVQALSARYQIGPTAIREALSRLVTEGLVLVEDQRGFLVSPVSKADLIDLTEARVDLESLTLTRSIVHGDTAWEADLMASYHRLSRCPPPTSVEAASLWGAMHRGFHETLIAGANSNWLRTLCGLLYDKSERYRYLANLRTPPRMRDRGDEHRELMDATLRRDAPSASRLLADHYRATTQIILESPEAASIFEPAPRVRARRAVRG